MQLDSGAESVGIKPTAGVLIDERLLPKRFLLVSNRLPYQVQVQGDEVELTRGVGGLVTALDPIMSHTGGTWVGWSGSYAVNLPGQLIRTWENTSNERLYLTHDATHNYVLAKNGEYYWRKSFRLNLLRALDLAGKPFR